MKLEKYISPLIASQFPSFYQEEGQNFIAFVKAYYEWLEQEGNVLNESRSLTEYTDIDETAEQFIKYFKNTYINSLPNNIIADKRLLIKHILDLYRAKGTKKAYELLFRLVFNEDVDFYIPGDNLFKSSEATWVTPSYIEVSDSPYLQYLNGKKIFNNVASAIVESYFVKKLNGKIINVLYISKVEGRFKFGEQIYCDDLYVNAEGNAIDYKAYSELSTEEKDTYSLAINSQNAPLIFGSLSAIGIINGGTNFKVGDEIAVEGSGKGGVARVVSTRTENGKVTFSLVNGGFGFTTNAVVTVTGGGGTGASFKVGGITNKTIYRLNDDIIDDKKDVQLDIDGSGMDIHIDTSTGNMTVGEYVTSSANVVYLDVINLTGSVTSTDSLSNTTLGISGLNTYWSNGSFISVNGDDADLTNANLVPGVVLTTGSGSLVEVINVWPKITITGNGTVTAASPITVTVNHVNGYFIPNNTIVGSSSGETANVNSVERLTDWVFPRAIGRANLDSVLEDVLTIFDLEVGTITYLSAINPGIGYSSSPTVDVVEPQILALHIEDGLGGYYGHDAQVTAKAGIANGIVTGIMVADSGFGYAPNEQLTMNAANGVSSVTGTAIIDLNGIAQGHWADSKGFTSDNSYLEDSYYYQKFSYELVAKRMLSTYEKMVKDLIHPSGIQLFGKYMIKDVKSEDVISSPYFDFTVS